MQPSFQFRSGMVRVGLILVWTIWGAVTICLVLFTGRPLERSFTPWEGKKLESEPYVYGAGDGSVDDLLWIDRSGHTYATTTTHAGRSDDRQIIGGADLDKSGPGTGTPAPRKLHDITFQDTLTNEIVGRLGPFDPCPGNFKLSEDRRRLLVRIDRFNLPSQLLLCELPLGRVLRSLAISEYESPLDLSPNGKLVLINRQAPTREIVVLDLEANREVCKLPRGPGFSRAFFDEHDRPFAVVAPAQGTQLELWDLTEARKVRNLSAQVHANLSTSADVSADRNALYVYEYDSGFEFNAHICSLLDGQPLGSLNSNARVSHFALSPDARFALHSGIYPNKAARQLALHWPRLYDWLPRDVRAPSESRVYDLARGTRWPGLPGSLHATFVQGSDRLVIFNEAGRYVFDVPPRWQYFTPWAWPALAVWLILAAIWWKLRVPRQKLVIPA